MKKIPLVFIVDNITSCLFLDKDEHSRYCSVELLPCVGIDHPDCPLNVHSGVWVQRHHRGENNGIRFG